MDVSKLLSGILPGKKTYLAALGLAIMGIVQFRAGDVAGAGQSLLAALAAAGLRNALDGGSAAPPSPPAPSP